MFVPHTKTLHCNLANSVSKLDARLTEEGGWLAPRSLGTVHRTIAYKSHVQD